MDGVVGYLLFYARFSLFDLAAEEAKNQWNDERSLSTVKNRTNHTKVLGVMLLMCCNVSEMVKFRKIFFDPDSYSDQSYSEKLRTQGRVSSVRASRYYYWDMMNEKPSGVCGNWLSSCQALLFSWWYQRLSYVNRGETLTLLWHMRIPLLLYLLNRHLVSTYCIYFRHIWLFILRIPGRL